MARQGSLSPSPSSGVWDRKKLWRSGSQCVGGSSWGQDCPAAEGLSLPLVLLLGLVVQGLLLLGGHVDHEVHHPVAVAKFVVVPGNELDKVVVEGNASPSMESGRVSVTTEVAGDTRSSV